ncbi:MAG: DNA repair protein RecN [Chitinophagaceae bacterium]|nr:DNA repair protein RecN [Chitinophagaceae bacterium]
MLKKLRIQNYAIIEDIEIEFSDKLNIITGETGAGKSILVGALSLILGERADTSVLLQKEKKCTVEGLFTAPNNKQVSSFLKAQEFDEAEEVIIRREIGANGKSRAFINDTPANLSQLQQLASLLVDLHQQFDSLQLGEDAFQAEVLDALAAHAELLNQYKTLYQQYTGSRKKLEELTQQQAGANKELDYYKFLYEELDQAGFKENELEELETELKTLSHAEQIKSALSKVYYELKESEQPLVPQLKSLLNQLQQLSEFHKDLPALIQRMQSVQIELQDIANELDHISESVNMDPARMQEVNDRMATGYKLLKKHNARTTAELLEIKKGLEQKLNKVLNLDEEITQLDKQVKSVFDKASQLASQISDNRKKQIALLEKQVAQLLTRVGMPNALLQVSLQKVALNPNGTDAIEFLFDANRSGRFEPLNKVASGGELSRLMLSIKSLVAKSLQMPTLIFDEIDTGISGEAAKQVGILMKELGRSHQVISITHQPQIAAKADTHFYVYKQPVNSKIKTHMRKLSEQERIEAIAKMLGGENPTAAALENAREMVGN